MSMHTNYGHPCITLPILYSKLMSRPFPSFFSLVRQSSHSSEAVYVPPLLFCPKQMRRPFSPFYSLVRLSESFPQKQCTSFFKKIFKGISSLFLTNDPVTSIAFAFWLNCLVVRHIKRFRTNEACGACMHARTHMCVCACVTSHKCNLSTKVSSGTVTLSPSVSFSLYLVFRYIATCIIPFTKHVHTNWFSHYTYC